MKSTSWPAQSASTEPIARPGRSRPGARERMLDVIARTRGGSGEYGSDCAANERQRVAAERAAHCSTLLRSIRLERILGGRLPTARRNRRWPVRRVDLRRIGFATSEAAPGPSSTEQEGGTSAQWRGFEPGRKRCRSSRDSAARPGTRDDARSDRVGPRWGSPSAT